MYTYKTTITIRWMFSLFVLILIGGGTANAYPTYGRTLINQYRTLGPNLTALNNSCALCHAATAPTLFGQTLRGTNPTATANVPNPALAIAVRLTAAEILDSDGDGINNLAEFNADTNPNVAAAAPTPVPVAPTVSLVLNNRVPTTGTFQTITQTLVSGNPAVRKDIYRALKVPDGTLLIQQPSGAFGTAITPVRSNVLVPNATRQLMSYTFNGSEMVGTYTWYAGLADPGTMNFNNSIVSTTFVFNPNLPVAPSAPTQVLASDNTFTDHVQVSWYSNNGSASFNIYRAATLNGVKMLLASNVTNGAYSDMTAVSGVTYYYWVEAVGSGGLRSALVGGDAGTRTAAVVLQLAAPVNVVAGDLTSTTGITITWNADTQANLYRVYRTSINNVTAIAGAPIYAGAQNTYTDTTAATGTTYWYWVKSVFVDPVTNARTVSPVSVSDAGTRLGAFQQLAAPVNIVINPLVPGTISLRWDAVPGATGYKILRTVNNGVGTFLLAPGTSYDDLAVTGGSTYSYRVRATTLANNVIHAYSAVKTVVARSTQPVASNVTVPVSYDNMIAWNTLSRAWANTSYSNYTLSVGCNDVRGINGPLGTTNSFACFKSLLYFDLRMISGKTINSAILKMTVRTPARNPNPNVPVNAHPLSSAWSSTVTNNTAPFMKQNPEGFAPAPVVANGVMSMDITLIVQAWANGALPNFGLGVHDHSLSNITPGNWQTTEFFSKEARLVSDRPQLIINYQ